MRKFLPTLLVALSALGGLAALSAEPLPDGLYAEFTTAHGSFVAELNYAQAPLTTVNFVGLAEGTLGPKADQPFYTGLKWYRVVPGFVIQSGNPRHPEDGDPGYTFPDELVSGLRHGETGVLSMANAGLDTNSSEFFITLGDCTRLNYLHSVFGRVIRGIEVLPKIQVDDPYALKIHRIGAVAQTFTADESTFRALVAKARKYSSATEPGPEAHFDDPSSLLPTEVPRAKNFNFKLANFERFTGRKIVARLFAKSPSAEEDAVAGAYMHALAQRLGVAQDGVLAVYFADENDWRIWIGDDLATQFLGRTATSADLAEGAALHDAKEAFFEAVILQAGKYTEQARKTRGEENPLTPADLVKYSVDAMLDALIFRFEPATQP